MTPEQHIEQALMSEHGETVETARPRLVLQVAIEVLSGEITTLQREMRDAIQRIEGLESSLRSGLRNE